MAPGIASIDLIKIIAFKTLRPLNNFVLIKNAKPLTESKGEFINHVSTKDQLNFGTVESVGPGRTNENGKFNSISVKRGDTVLFTEYGCSKVSLG